MSRRIAFVILLLVIAGAWWRILRSRSSGEIVLSSRELTLGNLSDSTPVVASLRVSNPDDAAVTITDVEASCGCTTPELSANTIDGHDSVELTIRFDPHGKAPGQTTKFVWLTVEDDSTHRYMVTLHANILAAHPSQVMAVKGIFQGSCARCHVEKGRGLLGKELFAADCLMCHHVTGEPGVGPMAQEMVRNGLTRDSLYSVIAHGRMGKNMPAFAALRGGPLTDKEISSLVDVLRLE
jgi:cytochrome c5